MGRRRRKCEQVESPEVRALLERAQRSGVGSAPRKHHLVPRFYLNQWAEGHQIRVTHIDGRKSYVTSPERAAKETDYYRVEAEGIDPEVVPPLLYETVLGEVEGWASEIIGKLNPGPSLSLDPELRAQFATFLAFQYTRGYAFRRVDRNLANELVKLQFSEITDEGIHELLIAKGLPATAEDVARTRTGLDELQSGEVYVVPQDAQIIGLSGKVAEAIFEVLFTRQWFVYSAPPILITCDEPVLAIGGPGFARGERAGLELAGVVVFPLSPERVLVTFRPDVTVRESNFELDHVETASLNREMLANTARWAFDRPTRNTCLRLNVPPLPAQPSVREGPFKAAEAGGGELYRTYVPTRWVNEAHPPDWPVPRWWDPRII